MKKILLSLFVFFVVLSSVVFGDDGYFYWMFSKTSKIDGIDDLTAWDAGASKGLIGYSSTDNPYNVMGHLDLYTDISETSSPSLDGVGIAADLSASPYYAQFKADLNDYYYFVELINDNGGLMGYYSLGQYSDLQAYIASADLQILPESAWGETQYKAIPEPTSGLLLLLGVAGLALRRKVRKA